MYLKFIGRHLVFFYIRFGCDSIPIRPIGLLVPKNIGVAVGILLLCCQETKIYDFEAI